MRIFINEVELKILKPGKKIDIYAFEKIEKSERIKYLDDVEGKVLFLNASKELVDILLNVLSIKVFSKLTSVAVMCENYEGVRELIKEKYDFVEAAGGLVAHAGKFLVIRRLDKWDLPKGKLEKNESPESGALREVEEECGVVVELVKKITNTRHTYSLNKRGVLKKTHWYLMHCKNDKDMQPQLEEDITEVKWMTPKEVTVSLKDSYASIAHVFEQYKKLGL